MDPSMSSRSTLPTTAYTVGWICALPLEFTAAIALLDEKHGKPERCNPSDKNNYSLGRIGEHNVVIACLPAGAYGVSSAGTVAQQMLSSFESVKVGLMVGIGGGVPSEEVDIRLGDVVVGQPKGTFGGVVQYDLGKTGLGGRFTRTGSLNKPPQALLTALSRIQAEHMLEDNKILENLLKIAMKYPKLQANFCTYPSGQDRLYQAEYDHVGDRRTCESCSRSELVSRPSRERGGPVVHYGTIASGNQVMKHGATRDRLRKELDNALCFEMEAAGLMDNFPCLVIRGICDYADSHKNDRWQEYAAAVAAVYAKELLHFIPKAEVEKATPAQERVSFGRTISGGDPRVPQDAVEIYHGARSLKVEVDRATPVQERVALSSISGGDPRRPQDGAGTYDLIRIPGRAKSPYRSNTPTTVLGLDWPGTEMQVLPEIREQPRMQLRGMVYEQPSRIDTPSDNYEWTADQRNPPMTVHKPRKRSGHRKAGPVRIDAESEAAEPERRTDAQLEMVAFKQQTDAKSEASEAEYGHYNHDAALSIRTHDESRRAWPDYGHHIPPFGTHAGPETAGPAHGHYNHDAAPPVPAWPNHGRHAPPFGTHAEPETTKPEYGHYNHDAAPPIPAWPNHGHHAPPFGTQAEPETTRPEYGHYNHDAAPPVRTHNEPRPAWPDYGHHAPPFGTHGGSETAGSEYGNDAAPPFRSHWGDAAPPIRTGAESETTGSNHERDTTLSRGFGAAAGATEPQTSKAAGEDHNDSDDEYCGCFGGNDTNCCGGCCGGDDDDDGKKEDGCCCVM